MIAGLLALDVIGAVYQAVATEIDQRAYPVEAEETPAVVIITWPVKPTVCHPRRFPEIAAAIVRLFATASTELARINARKRTP